MKKQHLIYALMLLLAGGIAFTACQKEASKPEENTTPATPAASFTWNEGSSNVKADEAFFVTEYNNIYAARVNGSFVDITLDNLNTGSHTIIPSQGITLEYSDAAGTVFKAKSGTVTISENNGARLSGNYSAVLSDGTSISGSFSNIPKKSS